MRFLVTGSAGHLGEALVRTLRHLGRDVVGLDRLASPFTTHLGSITDPACVRRCMDGIDVVLHTATLHKPHIATHSMRDFIEANIAGTANLLEAAVAAGTGCFVLTSTTSVFGDALRPPAGQPAAWVTEDVVPIPKNIYGVTKTAAEDLCHLFHRRHGIAGMVLRTSRFFPEADDNADTRRDFADENAKANEYLYRRVELEDLAGAHLLAAQEAPRIGFGRYIISATTPFLPEDLAQLRTEAPAVVARRVAGFEAAYQARGWKMFPAIDRVYVNARARDELGWRPQYDFNYVLECLRSGRAAQSELSLQIGSKGYHDQEFADGPYPVA